MVFAPGKRHASVSIVNSPDSSAFGVAIEGSAPAWPAQVPFVLPPFDSLNRQRSFIEIFPIGTQPIQYKLSADKPWIKLSEGKAFSAGNHDHRVWVDIDWNQAPVGQSSGAIKIEGSPRSAEVKVVITKLTAEDEQSARGSFGVMDGPIGINAQDAAANVAAGTVHWANIPDYGFGVSAMSIFPVTAASIEPPAPAPHLDYRVFFKKAGDYSIDLVTNPTLDLYPGRGLRVAVAIDDQTPQVVDVFSGSGKVDETFLGRSYNENTRNNSRVMHFTQHVSAPGERTIKVVMVDPTIVVEKIVIHDKPLPRSYFGPQSAKISIQ